MHTRYFAALLENLNRFTREGDESSAVALGMIRLADPAALNASACGLVRSTNPIMRALLYEMTIPRLYVFGGLSLPDDDDEILPEHGIQVAAVPRAGHGMVWADPDGFGQAIGDFVSD